jgi:hypothetical protein
VLRSSSHGACVDNDAMALLGPILGCAHAIALDKAHFTGMDLITFVRSGKSCPLFGAPGGSMIISAVL